MKWDLEGVVINKKLFPCGPGTSKHEVTGAICNFETNKAAALYKCDVTVTPSQSGTGDPSPANPRPFNSFSSLTVEHTGANMLDGARAKDYAIDTFSTSTSGTNDTGKYYTLRAGIPINGIDLFPWLKFKENTQYTLIFKLGKDNTATSTNIKVNYTDGTGLIMTRTSTSSDPEETEIIVFTTSASKSVKNITGLYQSGVTYLYYENIGIFSGVVTAQDFATFTGDPHTLALGSTVYGLTGSVKTGEFSIPGDACKLSDLTWTYDEARVKFVSEDLVDIIKRPATTSDPSELLCECLKSVTVNAFGNENNTICLGGTGKLNIRATDYTTAEDMLSAYGDYYLYYPLKTPDIITITGTDITTFIGDNNIYCSEDNSVMDIIYLNDEEGSCNIAKQFLPLFYNKERRSL